MIHSVIMAGGKGTRFWPLSRAKKGKQFLTLVGDDSLLKTTVQRIQPLTPAERTLIVTSADQQDAILNCELGLPDHNILYEPSRHNTAACIGWVAAHLMRQDPDAVMVVLAADHWIPDQQQFLDCVQQAADAATNEDVLVTLGIQPTLPHTGYGYIETMPSDDPIKAVKAFHEKPDRETAQSYLLSGNYFWNSGMFVWKASTILNLIQQHLPKHAAIIEQLPHSATDPHFATLYDTFDNISIDYGIMENAADSTRLIPATFQWSDLGSWSSLSDYGTKDNNGNTSSGDTHYYESQNNIVYSPHKKTVLMHMKDTIVVDTPDALLVCPVAHDQDIRNVVDQLPETLQ